MIFEAMGTVVSLQIDDSRSVGRVREVFRELEERFSLYDPTSELSRVARGELSLTNASEMLREVYAQAIGWRDATAGAFTPHRPDGVIDLDGIVKALALQGAARELGDADWCLNVGGDVLVNGTHDGEPWVVGIVDPADRTQLACAVRLQAGRRAVATSGTSERGEHVWRARPDASAHFAQVSVIADDIVTADVLATAILAEGPDFVRTVGERWGVDIFTATRGDEWSMSPGFRAAMVGTATPAQEH